MELQVASVFQKEGDEVFVDLYLEENGSVVSADSVFVQLEHEVENSVGLKTYVVLHSINVPVEYAGLDKHFYVRFKNPAHRVNLFINANAEKLGSTYTRKVSVGTPILNKTVITEVQTPIWQRDLDLDHRLNGGGPDILPVNEVILAPELRNHARHYVFNEALGPEKFEGLVYSGGGSRYLHDLSTHTFKHQ